MLLDVGFNREAALDSALYWTKQDGDLAALINRADGMEEEQRKALGAQARERIETCYSWEYITQKYEQLFCS